MNNECDGDFSYFEKTPEHAAYIPTVSLETMARYDKKNKGIHNDKMMNRRVGD